MSDKKASSALSSIGHWAQIAAIVLVSLGLAFGAWLLTTSQLLVSNAHQRNWQDIAVLEKRIESWPRGRTTRAARVEDDTAAKESAAEPDTFAKEFPTCPAGESSPTPYFSPGTRPNQSTLLTFQFESRGACRQTSITLAELLWSDPGASEFSNLLVATADGRVVAQVGEVTLPVDRLPGLTPVSAFAKETVRSISAEQAKSVGTGTSLTPLELSDGVARVRIADVDLFAYVAPFKLDGTNQGCPSRSPAPADSSNAAKLASTTSGAPPPISRVETACTFYLIGLMPAKMLRATWFKPPPRAFVGFGLALLGILALLPLTRLVLIGGTESASRLQLAGILVGVPATAAIGTLTCLFVYETASERQRAKAEASWLAPALAREAESEIRNTITEVEHCFTDGSFPSIKRSAIVSSEGTIVPPQPGATRSIRCGEPMPSSTDVRFRSYFENLMGSGAMTINDAPYSVAQSRSQLRDLPTGVIMKRLSPEMTQDLGLKGDNFLIVSWILGALTAPILPAPQNFLVVDGNDPRLAVLFHSQADRAGSENFTIGGSAVADIRRSLYDLSIGAALPLGGEPFKFSAVYDGRRTHFTAVRVPNTRWILMIYHRVDDVDEIAAGTAMRALLGWAGIALLTMLISIFVIFHSADHWRRLWPFEAATNTYRNCAIGAFLTALTGIAITASGIAGAFLLTLLLSLLAVLGTGLLLVQETPTPDALCARTERRYRHMVLALLACISVTPMAALWVDARALTREGVDAAQTAQLRQSLLSRANELQKLGKVQPVTEMPGVVTDASIRKQQPRSTFARTLWDLAIGFEPGTANLCDPPRPAWACTSTEWKTPRPEGDDSLVDIGVAPHRMPAPPQSAILGLIAFAIAVCAAIYWAVFYGLWSLTGFGIPLNAVRWPSLKLPPLSPNGDVTEPASTSPDQAMPLARRTLLVAPQQILRNRIYKDAGKDVINLADKLLPLPDSALTSAPADGEKVKELLAWRPDGEKNARLVVTGLELIIRDPGRRRVALTFLERASELVQTPPYDKRLKLVVIAEMSPLERILEAYESTDEDKKAREDLRWARLFQSFTTFSFAPIDKISEGMLDEALPKTPDNLPKRTLVEELRWLPASVIDSVISVEHTIDSDNDHFPIAADRYASFYTPKVIGWAASIAPCTEAAAVDFLRSNLIEYYAQCWAASSIAERVILDTIARGHYVNMRTAVALQSLVRRGLVILDPAPRLMNRSFALFVLQAERPGSMHEWRKNQPKSAWSLARLPISVLLPAAIVVFAIAAAESGQDLTALIPMLATAAPALLGMIARGTRTGSA